MDGFQRRDWINLALTKFTRVDLPDSKAAVLTFNGNNIKYLESSADIWKPANLAKITIENTVNNSQPIDLENLLKNGLEKFGNSGGTFVILIGGVAIKSTVQQIQNSATALRSANIKVKIIVYPVFDLNDRKESSELFKKLISITGGSVTYIREDKTLQNSASTLTQLFKAFESVRTDYSGSHIHSYHIIEEKSYQNPNGLISFNFNVDTTFNNRELRVYFIQATPTSGGILINLNLTDKDGGLHNGELFDSADRFIRGFKVSTGNLMTGLWKLSAQSVPDTKSDLKSNSLIGIAEFASNSIFDEQSITAKCWLSSDVEHDPTKPLLIYVQVMQGIQGLVQNASVQFTLTYEDGTINRSQLCLDNGLGDPDITKGDGIYSQYIVDIRKAGYYYITVTVKDTNKNTVIVKDFGSTSLPDQHNTKYCCGSKVEGQSNTFNENFNRIVDCGSIFVTNDWPTENYPPNTIRDLRIESVDYYNRTVYLRWTSPGGDFTLNQANKYVIKVFHGKEDDPDLRKDVRDNFDSKGSSDVDIKPISPAQSYGVEQNTEIKVKSLEGGMYYFAIKSIDKENHESDVSNIVVAYIKSNVPITSTTALSNKVSKDPGRQ